MNETAKEKKMNESKSIKIYIYKIHQRYQIWSKSVSLTINLIIEFQSRRGLEYSVTPAERETTPRNGFLGLI